MAWIAGSSPAMTEREWSGRKKSVDGRPKAGHDDWEAGRERIVPDRSARAGVAPVPNSVAIQPSTIGTTDTALDSRRSNVRGGEAAIGNLIADAMRATVSADVAITNGGGIRADRQYDAGTRLTRGDVFAELPFGNKLVKLEVTGADIEAAIENGLSQVEEGAGRFPQVSGLVVKADLKRPPGMRVFSVTVNGAPLEEGKTYTLATNDFMAAGGDGYTVLKSGKPLINAIDAKLLASAVIDYVEAKKEIAPKVEGRLVTE
jgi:2',3'-cyclic-nucleotide 2'-phosphodiesterase (5'-nucleotidase family)